MIDAGKNLIRGLLVVAALGLAAAGCSAGGTALNDQNPAGLAKIQNLDVQDSADATTVVVDLDREVTYTTVKMTDPPMMVMDLAGVELGESAGTRRVDMGKVTYVTASLDTVAKKIARLEIGLTSAAKSSISQEGSRISIKFEKSADEAAAAITAPSSVEVAAQDAGDVAKDTAVAEAAAPVETAKASETAKAPEAPAFVQYDDATMVDGISFSKDGEGVSVTVDGNGRFASPNVFMLGDDRLVIDLNGVGAEDDKMTVDVGSSTVQRIRMARHDGEDGKVRVVLDLANPVDYDVNASGKGMVVAVSPRGMGAVARVVEPANAKAAPVVVSKTPVATKKAAPTVEARKADPAVETKMAAGRKVTVSVPPAADNADTAPSIYVSQKDGNTVLSSAPPADAETASKVDSSNDKFVVTQTKIYTGGKISFDIQDADLDKVIKLLADVAGLNLIMDPGDVKGKVTLKLANVPWDQALDILLKIYQLDKVLEGNVLRVAPKAKLDAERKVDLKAIKEQKDLIEAAEDLYTKTFRINYADAETLEGQVKKSLSKRGDATAIPRTNELIVTDIREKLNEVQDLIDILDKEVNQIMIEARIVTVTLGYSQSLGISWGLAGQANIDGNREPKFGLASGTNSSLGFNTADGSFSLGIPGELGAAAAGLATGMTWTNIAEGVNLDLTISALEAINKAETLAAPKVMTLENKKAQITQGTTLYIQTTSASGTAPQPLNANLSLSVTPRVTGNNLIIMQVDATNNSPSTDVPAGSTASIETQAVKTNVLVKDGETIVLGGIYVKTKGNSDSHVPWLGRIPILGWLFKETVDNEDISELLIFITPKLIKQANTIRA